MTSRLSAHAVPACAVRAYYLGQQPYEAVLQLQERLFRAKIDAHVQHARAVRDASMQPPPHQQQQQQQQQGAGAVTCDTDDTRSDRASSSATAAACAVDDVLLYVEHTTHVYTVGRRDTTAGLPPHDRVPVIRTRRGGGLTYHGPGQLAVYPIAHVQQRWRHAQMMMTEAAAAAASAVTAAAATLPASPIEWLSAVLEQVMCDVAAHYGVPTHCHKTGVWSNAHGDAPARKLASIGLQLGHWVSMHGATLNVCPALTYFDDIVMCEMPDKAATTLHREMTQRRVAAPLPSVHDVLPYVHEALCRRLLLLQSTATSTTSMHVQRTVPLVDVSTHVEWAERVLRDMTQWSASP